MKKLTSKLISVLLIMTLLFTSAGTVFGAETKQTAVSAAPETMKSINATSMLYSTTKKAAKTYKGIQPDTMKIIPVVAKNTGMMYLDAKNISASSSTVSVYLSDLKEDFLKEDILSYEWHLLDKGESDLGESPMPVSAGKTYYIAIENESYGDYAADVQITPYVYTTGQRNLVQGDSKWVVASGITKEGKTSSVYYKIKPTKTGLMSVQLTDFDDTSSTSGDITLYNSNSKAISKTLWYYSANSSNRAYFGVKKGLTYYIKVTDCYGSYLKNNKYGIKYSVTGKTDRALSSKSKAKTLNRKASSTESLFVASTAKSTDYYKIKVTSKRKTAIDIDTTKIKSGNIYVTLYKGSKKIGKTITIYPGEDARINYTYGTTSGKVNAGTYYVKVQQGTKASGSYKIRYAY